MAAPSSTCSSLDLGSPTHFPSYRELPFDDDIDDLFYKSSRDGVFRPSHHWAFIAEIVEVRTARLPPGTYFTMMGGGLGWERPRYLVRDREGADINVAFHTEPMDMMMYGFDEKKYAVGSTIAVLYANSHHFMDGTIGLRIEELVNVKVIPCSLRTLLAADPDSAADATSCKRCSQESDKLLACSSCKTKYCSKRCQLAHWKVHKAECAATRQVREWGRRDWDIFDGFWEEATLMEGLKLAGRDKGRRYK